MKDTPENNRLPKAEYLLPVDEVHVWHVNVERVSAAKLENVLSKNELKRACGYHFPKDRENFIISRGVLRSLIFHYLSIPPEHVPLNFNKYGKPFLKREGNLKFNVSHSNGLILLAFARNPELGIDIEFIRPEFAGLEIAEHFFSKAEMLALSVLPEEERKRAFFNCWTRKEAFIKAIGKGLSIPLDSFDVSVCPGDPPELLSVHDEPGEHRNWKIFNLEVPPGYCAALAIRGNPGKIKHFEFEGEIHNNTALSCPAVIRLQ